MSSAANLLRDLTAPFVSAQAPFQPLIETASDSLESLQVEIDRVNNMLEKLRTQRPTQELENAIKKQCSYLSSLQESYKKITEHTKHINATLATAQNSVHELQHNNGLEGFSQTTQTIVCWAKNFFIRLPFYLLYKIPIEWPAEIMVKAFKKKKNPESHPVNRENGHQSNQPPVVVPPQQPAHVNQYQPNQQPFVVDLQQNQVDQEQQTYQEEDEEDASLTTEEEGPSDQEEAPSAIETLPPAPKRRPPSPPNICQSEIPEMKAADVTEEVDNTNPPQNLPETENTPSTEEQVNLKLLAITIPYYLIVVPLKTTAYYLLAVPARETFNYVLEKIKQLASNFYTHGS